MATSIGSYSANSLIYAFNGSYGASGLPASATSYLWSQKVAITTTETAGGITLPVTPNLTVTGAVNTNATNNFTTATPPNQTMAQPIATWIQGVMGVTGFSVTPQITGNTITWVGTSPQYLVGVQTFTTKGFTVQIDVGTPTKVEVPAQVLGSCSITVAPVLGNGFRGLTNSFLGVVVDYDACRCCVKYLRHGQVIVALEAPIASVAGSNGYALFMNESTGKLLVVGHVGNPAAIAGYEYIQEIGLLNYSAGASNATIIL